MNDQVAAAFRECARRATELSDEAQASDRTWGESLLDLKGEPAWTSAIKCFEDDPAIGPRLGQPLSCIMGGIGELQTAQILESFVGECVSAHRAGKADDEFYEDLFERYVNLARSGDVSADVIVALDGLTLPGERIRIGPHELRAGAAPTDFHAPPPTFSFFHSKSQATLRRRILVPRGKPSQQTNEDFIGRVHEEARTVVDLLRLVTNDWISAPWVSIKTRMFSSGGGTGTVLSPAWRYGATLTPNDVQLLNRLYPNLEKAPSHVRVALRRFGMSRTESDGDEQVLHLMSAAEALFLPGESNESAYKLALRGALFADGDRARRALFQVLKKAYGVRSKVAHGSTVAKKDRVGLQGETMNASEFASVVNMLVGEALKKAIGSGVPEPDWDALVFRD